MQTARRFQRGMGMTGILLVLVIAGVFLTVLFKLGPLYMEHQTLKSVMQSIADAPEPTLGGKHAIMMKIEKGMEINNLRGISGKDISFVKGEDGRFDVTAKYERREHLFFNIDAVVTFENQVKVRGK